MPRQNAKDPWGTRLWGTHLGLLTALGHAFRVADGFGVADNLGLLLLQGLGFRVAENLDTAVGLTS